QPLNQKQEMVRRQSVINLENFKRQYARRRWKLSISIVSFCNHLTRMMKKDYIKKQEDMVSTTDMYYLYICEFSWECT
ncbi:DAPK2 kinase, partial [Polyodon spathula]|nr:DAPK2 kinase [Polyodon spathula]